MDIAYYISDLLGQQGELSVPNLGYFVQTRMNAWYDDKARQFHPPHFSVLFDPQVIDDDETLATYISSHKKISLASAKYFIEKYTGNLKNQVVIEDVPFANIGTFSSNGVKLTFQSDSKTDDPGFFAFKPVDAYKVGEARVKTVETDTPPIVTQQPAAVVTPAYQAPTPVAVEPVPVAPAAEFPLNTTPAEEQEEYEYEEEPARSLSVWIIVLIIVLALAAAFVGVYKFKPQLFGSLFSHKEQYSPNNNAPVSVVKKDSLTAKNDSLKKDSAAKIDTAKLTPPPVATPDVATTTPPTAAATTTATASPDSVVKGDWVIRAGAAPTKSGAEQILDNLKGKGFTQARLEKKDVKRGNNYKVILGVYKTREAANSAQQDLVATGKIKAGNIPIEKVQ
jgi:hypothetical protein